MKEMYLLVDKAEKILTDESIGLDEFGGLLNASWALKRQTGKAVSTDRIDELYQKGIKAGAIGGKLLGAGGGGFLLFYVPKNKQEAVFLAMRELLYIPFTFENEGTKIIYYAPEHYAPREQMEGAVG